MLIAGAREAGALGACLSGDGSTVVAFSDSSGESDAIGLAMLARAEGIGLPGKIRIVGPRNLPARASELQREAGAEPRPRPPGPSAPGPGVRAAPTEIAQLRPR